MCDHGTDVEVANLLAFNGEWHRRTWKIDACIASIVKALNGGGVDTVASCCGHGGWGNIALADGRELLIAPDYESARLVEIRLPRAVVTPSETIMRAANQITEAQYSNVHRCQCDCGSREELEAG